MPIPITSPTASSLYDGMKQGALNVRGYCFNVQSGAAGAGVTASALLTLLAGSQGALAIYAQVGGATTAMAAAIQAYVQQQYADTTLQVITGAEASAVALQALVAAVLKDFPVDAGGHMLIQTIDPSTGIVSPVMLTAAQLPNTLPAIAAWLSTVS